MTTRNDHKVMIEQGDAWAIVRFSDRSEDPGKSAVGRWVAETSDTSDDESVSFTSSAREYLRWDWTASDPGTLVFGVESDQSKSSHKEGEGKWVQVLITLTGVRRNAAGAFSGPADGGKGKLAYGSRIFKAGPIAWSMVRYER